MQSIPALAPGSTGPGIYTSGHVIAPGAGATIVSSSVFLQGTYLVEVWAGFTGGVPAPAEIRNMEIFSGQAGQLLVLPMTPVVGRLDYFSVVTLVRVEGVSFNVRAIGAATAGVGYLAGLKVTRVL